MATTTATVQRTRTPTYAWIGLAAVIVVLFLVPQVIKSIYWVSLLNLSMIFGMTALGLNFVLGYTGQISLAQAAFWGIGPAKNCRQKPASKLLLHRFGWIKLWD